MKVQKIDNWTFIAGGTVYFIADNYGHHSCIAMLYKCLLQEWEECNRKLEPREETYIQDWIQEAEEEDDFQLLIGNEEFQSLWNKHAQHCDELAEMYRQNGY